MNNSILIIDDDIWGIESLADCILLSIENAKVDIAHTIEEAINLIEENEYKAILCDLMMPPATFLLNEERLQFQEQDGFNGRKIVEYCIDNEIYQKTKIIITSQAIRSSKALVEKYSHKIEMLRKPFLVEELLDKLKNAH